MLTEETLIKKQLWSKMMDKKIILAYLLILGMVIVSGCAQSANQTEEIKQEQPTENQREDYINQQQVTINSEEELFKTIKDGIKRQLSK